MELTEREQFKQRIKEICDNYDKHGSARFVLHNWDIYFDYGYRVATAIYAFDNAIRCE